MSLKPKSAAANAWLPSSRIVTVLSVPDGVSLTESTVIVKGWVALVSMPSLIAAVAFATPWAFGATV